jgi:D-xylose reductase
VIPKSNDPKRLLENLNCNDFNLSEEEIKDISGLNKGIRFNDPADIDPRMAIFA